MNVFNQLKVESEYWTGYKPDLIDKVQDRGNELERQNEELRKALDRSTSGNRRFFLKMFGGIVGFVAMISVFAFLLFLMIFGMINGEKREQIFYYGYELGQVEALSGKGINYEMVTKENGETVWELIHNHTIPSWFDFTDSVSKETWKLVDVYEIRDTRDKND